MATQNVKILLRRGLREQLTSDILDTGELGFTTDTNQLFIGIDPAIDEVQFDPFINAHAIIQSWLESDDCPFEGLVVDEDLVIRNIPTTYSADGSPTSGVELLLERMHFFTQTISLVGDFSVVRGDRIYQRKFVYSDTEADIENLEPGKTYKIIKLTDNNQAFFINAAGLISKTFKKHDNFTVRADYNDVPNLHSPTGARVVEIVDTINVADAFVNVADPYNPTSNSKNIEVTLREGHNEFVLDYPFADNYYHFNGNGVDNSLDSDFGLFMYSGGEWVKQKISIVDEANYPDYIEQVEINGVEIDKPKDTLLAIPGLETHVVVTKSSKVTYWKNDVIEWKLLGYEKYASNNAIMFENSAIHDLPDDIVQAYLDKPGGRWEVIHTQNSNAQDGESATDKSVRVLTEAEIVLWYMDDWNGDWSSGTWPGYNGEPLNYGIYIPGTEGDAEEDTIEVRYYYNDDFQFSNKPPTEYTNQNDTFTVVTERSNGDPLVEGDYYVYTDKDIFGGVNLNIFKWSQEISGYQHDGVPVFYSDELATANATDGVLIYALPFKFEEEYNQLGILELRQRDYDTSEFWYPYEYNDILSYYFTKNPIPNVAEPDVVYAYSIDGKSEFSVGHLGRARQNVEVLTENSFNQMFADQHLSAHHEYTGLRPSLFRKIFDDEDGIFLSYNRNICSTFFVDYSLKQTVGTKVFIRVGQLRIINGYPHGIPEIKLTDENTEIWHDMLSGNKDDIENYDEFSNIVFETAIEIDAFGNETNNLLIIYKQDLGSNTEVSYTVKRWTM